MQSGLFQIEDIEYSPNKEVAYITCSLQDWDLDFEEGQFLMLETTDYMIEGKTLKKPYSIASTHNQFLTTKTLSFLVKEASDSGMSYYLTQNANAGDQLKFSGPLWAMTDDKTYSKYLFVSIGSGLGPLYAHYLHIVNEDPSFDKVVNLFGEKSQSDLIASITEQFQKNNDKIKNILLLSREKTTPAWYTTGHVQDKLDEALEFLEDKDFVAFLCGKPQMVMDIQQKLLDYGLKDEQIKFETY